MQISNAIEAQLFPRAAMMALELLDVEDSVAPRQLGQDARVAAAILADHLARPVLQIIHDHGVLHGFRMLGEHAPAQVILYAIGNGRIIVGFGDEFQHLGQFLIGVWRTGRAFEGCARAADRRP